MTDAERAVASLDECCPNWTDGCFTGRLCENYIHKYARSLATAARRDENEACAMIALPEPTIYEAIRNRHRKHIHKAGQEGDIDTCAHCGRDIRDAIHARIGKEGK